jgi:hypothetical protein
MNPSRPNDSLQGFQWSKMLFTDFYICFGSKGSFLFWVRWFTRATGSWQKGGIGTTRESAGDGAGSVKPTQFRPDLASSSGFLAETHAWHLSLVGYRERSSQNTTYSGQSLFLSLSLSLAGVHGWWISLSLSLSPSPSGSLFLSPSLLLVGIWTVQTNFLFFVERYQAIIWKIINIKNNRNRKKKKISLDGFGKNCPERFLNSLGQTVWNFGRFCPNRPEIHLTTLYTGRFKTVQEKPFGIDFQTVFLNYILDGFKPSRICFFFFFSFFVVK